MAAAPTALGFDFDVEMNGHGLGGFGPCFLGLEMI